jgi:serine/threonine protein kinase/WD40 repeat protein
LLEKIAEGGMGVVYKARQLRLNRIVAVKMIQPGRVGSPEMVLRFRAEAEAAANLHHPHIVAIHETGECEGQHYFSMDYIEGRNLAEAVREGPLPSTRAAQILQQTAEALHYAHQRGILHRDLKPSNVILDEAGEPRVTDFGLARRLTGDSTLTLTGQVFGSPRFMPPEQASARHGTVGVRSDVYGLGAILYYLLTARPPFVGETLETTLAQVLEQEPVSPRLLNASVPRDLETICLKCLEKEPSRRYASAQAVAEELGRFLSRKPIEARPVNLFEKVWRWCRRRPVRAGLIAALVVVTLAGAAGVLTEWRWAELARRDALEKLWGSYLAQARANRWSGQPGRRFDSLVALSNAAAIRPSPKLRNEAIACLALPDAQVQRQIKLGKPLAMGDSLVFDARFERYARIDEDGTIRVCQANDDRELFVLAGPAKPEAAYALFSPDGQWLAERCLGAETNLLLIWNLARRDLVLSQPLALGNLAFSPDSRQLAAVQKSETNAVIHFYDPALRQEVRTIALPQHIGDVRFDPGGRRLAVSSPAGQTVRVLELEPQAIARELAHPGRVRGIAWSRDGSCLAVCSDLRVYLWDMRHADRRPTALEGHTSPAWGVMFNQGGDLLASYGWDGMTRLWDPKAGRLLVSLPGQSLPMNFAPDDRALGFTVSHKEAGIWEVDAARECRRLGPAGVLWSAQFTPDGRLLLTASGDGVRLWSVEANQLLGFLPVNECRSVILHPDGRSLIIGGWSGLQRWPIAWSRPGAEVRLGPAAQLWRQSTEQSCLTPDGHSLIATRAGNADALVLDFRRPDQPRRLMGHPMAGFISISPDGQWFATGTWKGTGVMVWETQTGQPIKELPVPGNAGCAFSPDGRWLLTGNAEEYRFWRVASWDTGLAVPREGAGDMFGSMGFSPDGLLAALLIGRNSGLRLIAVSDGHELATLDTGKPLCFSRDGGQLATATEDGRFLLVWDLRAIRRHLATMKLDWQLPPMPPPENAFGPTNLTLTILTNPPANPAPSSR